jgi:hypothetical protein
MRSFVKLIYDQGRNYLSSTIIFGALSRNVSPVHKKTTRRSIKIPAFLFGRVTRLY